MEDQVSWSLTHLHYVNMGGCVVRSGVGKKLLSGPHIGVHNGLVEDLPTTKTSVDPTPNIHEPDKGESIADVNSQNLFHLDAYAIFELRRDKVLPRLPSISKEELEDKSKSDLFVKVIAIVQISWATLQILVRAGRKLTISQLELTVIAFASCAVIIYGLYWTKPKNIQTTTTILQYQGQIPSTILRKITRWERSLVKDFLLFQSEAGRISRPRRQGTRIKNDDSDGIEDSAWDVFFLGTLGAVLFGGIHIAAWNFRFPSRIELILWRCASTYATAFMPCLIILRVIDGLGCLGRDAGGIYIPLLSGLYLTSRLFLLIEIFRTLCFLPPDAYVSTWVTNVPHVA